MNTTDRDMLLHIAGGGFYATRPYGARIMRSLETRGYLTAEATVHGLIIKITPAGHDALAVTA